MMHVTESALDDVFAQLLKSRGGKLCTVTDPEIMDLGVKGIIQGHTVILGTQDLMAAAQVTIPEGASVAQAVYCAVDGKLAAVFAINYNRTKASAAGLVTLGSCRKIRPLVLSNNFLLTPELIKEKFKVRTKRIDFPQRDVRRELEEIQPSEELIAAALVTQRNLSSAAYAVTGAKTLRSTCRVGMVLHIVAGVVGMLIMYALAYLGELELLSPLNILMYQVVWMLPALLITEWTRTV
jgi:hypothetical protein